MTVQDRPLREQKRHATFATIEDCATRLVLEHGINDVTVDDICKAAGVSRRTFFNYVDSKDVAVMGFPPQQPDDEAFGVFVAEIHPDLATALIDFMLDGINGSPQGAPATSREVILRRKQIRRRHPELAASHFAAAHVLLDSAYRAVGDYYQAHPQARTFKDVDVGTEIHAVVTLASCAIQLGYRLWTSGRATTAKSLRTTTHTALNYLNDLSGARS